MRMRSRIALAFSVFGIVAASGSAVAAPAPHGMASARPAPPRPGFYKVASAFSTGGKGYFRIANGHVKGFTAVADDQESQYCGTDSYQILGKQAIHYVTGGGHQMWIVGKRYSASESYEISPIAVTVKHGTTRSPGKLRMRFDVNGGQLDLAGCTMTFSLQRAHG
jgi:hypothetical protein